MAAITVESASMTLFVGMFVFYIISHAGIIWYTRHIEKEAETDKDLKNIYKLGTIMSKWYPALYVIIVIAMLYGKGG